MKRVMIVGGPGSGKSTLAVQLGEVTGLPVFHMDKIHYLPGWIEREKAAKAEMTRQIHALDQWIFEGGHSATYPERTTRADHFIWLDVPVWTRIYRVLYRTYKYYGQVRPDLQDECPERFNWQTLDFLWFIIRTRHSSRQKLLNIYQNPPRHLQVFRLTTQADIDAFMTGVRSGKVDQSAEQLQKTT